jgi:hypothetical protein
VFYEGLRKFVINCATMKVLTHKFSTFNKSVTPGLYLGAWGSVVLKALRYYSEGLGIDPQWYCRGFFSVATDGNMCPGVDSASKNEYQETLRGKDGQCVRVTTLPPPLCRTSWKSGPLIYLIPKGLFRPVAEHLYLYLYLYLEYMWHI